MLYNIMAGLMELLSVNNFIFLNIGVLVGIIIGAIPGLNANIAIVLVLPFTFNMDPVTGIIMLVGIFCASNFGGSISAILIKTPGTGAAAATVMDGSALAEQGYARKALYMALVASTIGGMISAFSLLFVAPQVARIALNFGPPEYFALAMFGLSVIAAVSGESIAKGLISGAIGILVSCVGPDIISGTIRFTFGNIRLMAGVSLIPALLGLFAISRILQMLNKEDKRSSEEIATLNKEDHLTKEEVMYNMKHILKSSIIGTVIGAIPGAGAGIAAFVSYNEAKRKSKHPEKFGKGSLEGIAAPEAGNNGATAATLIPLLTLGIPGGAVAATLLGAFMMHGLIPGPSMFTEQADIIYAIMLGVVFANIFMLLQGRLLMGTFAKISRVPMKLLTTVLLITVFTGAFAFSNSIFNIYIVIAFGVFSYMLQLFDFPVVPIVLGIVLGKIFESNLRNSLVMSSGSLTIFFTRPISLLLILTTIFFILTIRKQMKRGVA